MSENVTHDGEVEDKVEESMIMLVVVMIMVLSFLCNRGVAKLGIGWMTESATTILVGLGVGLVMKHMVGGVYRDAVHFDESTFTYAILPPIIFEAGFSLRHKGVTDNLFPILTLAIFGTIGTAIFLGFTIYAVSEFVYSPLHNRPLWESMCFGAILSAIDPVAVIAVLGKMFKGNPPRIFYIIFGESVLNDAVAIVLYKVFLKFLREGKSMDVATLFESLGVFIGITLASICIGWVVAAMSALLLKNIDFSNQPTAELCILLFFGFGSFYIAEASEMSGIMALFICGRASCHYSWHNMSTLAQVVTPQILHVLAFIAETYVFSFLGLAFWSFEHEWEIGFTSIVLLLLMVSRVATVFPFLTLTNALSSRKKRVSVRAQVFMSLTGLRGAIAFGLALSADTTPEIDDKIGRQFVSTTLILIAVSVFTFGNLSHYLFSKLGLDKEVQREAEEQQQDDKKTSPETNGGNARLKRLVEFEKKYVAPYLRVADYRTHHERRYTEITHALEDLHSKYAIKAVPQQSPSEDAETPPADAPEPMRDVQEEETA